VDLWEVENESESTLRGGAAAMGSFDFDQNAEPPAGGSARPEPFGTATGGGFIGAPAAFGFSATTCGEVGDSTGGALGGALAASPLGAADKPANVGVIESIDSILFQSRNSPNFRLDLEDDFSGFERRVRPHVNTPQNPSPDLEGDRPFFKPQSLPCPGSGGNGGARIGAYNQTKESDDGQDLAASVRTSWNSDTDASGAPGRPDQIAFLVLVDVMHNVQFSDHANAEREEWSAFDPAKFCRQRGAVEFAQIIGGYVHSNILQSPTLREFFGALQQSSDALSEQFQRLLTVQRSAAVARVISAIYVFWRIEQELLHPMYAEQLASWSTLKVPLLEILTELQQGDRHEDDICTDLQGLFQSMDRQVRLGLQGLHAMYSSRRFNTGSFAEVLWAPRTWCFLVMLRLRHDEDFSRALWDKGFRLVACDLDPTAAAPEKEAWTKQVLAAGVLPDGAGGVGGSGGVGGGVAGVAANTFAGDPNSPEMLLAWMLKAEGRAADMSKTMQRMRLIYQGLPFIARPPPTPPQESATSEFASLFSKLTLCRQSDREAKELLDKETYDSIFKTAAAGAAKGGGGKTRSAASSVSTPGTQGGGGARGGEREETKRVLKELHDFRDAAGRCTSDWVLQVLSLLALLVQECKY
jgi:hypothetical protein